VQGVDEAVHMKIQMNRGREQAVRELEHLMDTFYRIRSIAEKGGVAGSLPLFPLLLSQSRVCRSVSNVPLARGR
jgi:hypothetical protein